jgi:hypothetical protein
MAEIAYEFDPVLGAGMEIFNLLAVTFSSMPEDKLGGRHSYLSCSFSARDIKGWKRISQPTGVEQIPSATQTLWYQSGDAMMQVVCVPKNVSLEQWGQGTINGLPPKFDNFDLLGQASFQFKSTPAHWIAYKGAPKGFTRMQRGYLVLVDRVKVGLIISLAVPEVKYDQYAPLFRVAVDSIQLN